MLSEVKVLRNAKSSHGEVDAATLRIAFYDIIMTTVVLSWIYQVRLIWFNDVKLTIMY